MHDAHDYINQRRTNALSWLGDALNFFPLLVAKVYMLEHLDHDRYVYIRVLESSVSTNRISTNM